MNGQPLNQEQILLIAVLVMAILTVALLTTTVILLVKIGALTKKYNAVFAQPSFSTDNAAGIAYLTFRKFENVYTSI